MKIVGEKDNMNFFHEKTLKQILVQNIYAINNEKPSNPCSQENIQRR